MPGRSRLKLAVLVTLSVLLVLGAARLVGGIPKQLLVVTGVIFLVWSAALWGLNRRTAQSAARQISQLLLAWIATTAVLLGAVYHFDRAGWLWLQLTGYDVTLAEDLADRVDLSIAEFIDRHPFFSVDSQDSTRLVLRKGEYDVDETIVVPRGSSLTIEAGAVVRFAAGRSLISYSPIIARGTDTEPILFTAQQPWLKWGVVGIVRAGQSIFEHVRVEHGRQALVNNVDFFGSLSLIEADVEIAHSQFLNLFGKDAVYVRGGQALIRDNLFREARQDCLDLDGGAGEISHNQFINCGDEGIDLSESGPMRVFGNKILDRGGGRISADTNLDEIKSSNTLGYSGDEEKSP